MSLVSVVPEAVASAAGQLETIGSALTAAQGRAAIPTTGIAAMAADDVSAAIQSLFAEYAQGYQAVGAQAAAFHSTFVSLLSGGASQYVSTELANVQQALASAVNPPAAALTAAATQANGGGGGAGKIPILDIPTPLGPITATVTATVDGSVMPVGTLTVPPAIAYGLDALGAPLSAATAFGNSVTAIGNAVQTGNPIGALIGLLNTPGNVVRGFFYGGGTFTQSLTLPSGLLYSSAAISIPYGGLLAPLQPATATFTSPTGSSTVVTFDGTQFGGLVPAVQDGLLLPAVRGLLLPAV
ncbi:PE family protein [Mycobacterium sp. Marseille-P9652]|uniref:PE family protein n=1 Tax=Mycobacterium sp. Marseille-P9652 TaxID=2654950 RepID=UPI0012E792C7|nr:PE family protein [Mycobacterium sp. Marseille-P9652]